MIKESGEFVINLTPTSLVKAADYCGIYTGAKVDKFLKCNLTKEEATEVKTPLIAECPLSLECKVTDVIPLGSHDMFMADIVAVDVDESLLDKEGKLHLEKAGLAAYAHGEYFALGEKLGSFGFSTKKAAPKKLALKKNTVENKPKTAPVSKENGVEENKKRPFYLDAPRGKGTKSKGKGKKK